MNKQELRVIFLQKRMLLSAEEYAARNEKLSANFFSNTNLSGIGVVHVFLPMIKNKEPDTWRIIERIQQEYPAIRISIPRVNNKSGVLENYYFDSTAQLKENKWGIQEPQFGERTHEKDIDLVIVPLLAVDKKGHRVGYGKGYYDKLLASCRPDCKKIGVSILDVIDQITDINEFDIPLDACITPFSIERFNAKSK